MLTTGDAVFDANRPWVHFRGRDNIETLAAITPNLSGLRVYSLDGSKMADADEVFERYYSEFDFPAYFGWNWAALDECLTTLKNLPSRKYLTIIHDAHSLLVRDRQDLRILLRTLNDVGHYWAHSLEIGREWGEKPVAFNTILLSNKYTSTELSMLMTGS
ncbi:barstar family protein [Nocardia sp. NPDC023988]|uniref:barstar family protein n=1 Tax=unclassified Nocardia TaxID=2637762 RepID=UPI00340F04AC